MRAPYVPWTLWTLVLTACSGSDVQGLNLDPDAALRADRHVLVIGIDGLRGDLPDVADTPHLDALRARGAYTATARSQTHSRLNSGPGWHTLFTGVLPSAHRVTDNDRLHRADRAHPTFVGVAHALGARTSVSATWSGIHRLIEAEAVDHAVEGDDASVEAGAAEGLATTDTQMHLVVFDELDAAGHAHGFVPTVEAYRSELEEIDGQVGTLLSAIEARPTRADESWLVAIVTDHGGDLRGHGRDTADIRTIPFLVSADGDSARALPATGVHQLDLMPTVLSWMGIGFDTESIPGVSRSVHDEVSAAE